MGFAFLGLGLVRLRLRLDSCTVRESVLEARAAPPPPSPPSPCILENWVCRQEACPSAACGQELEAGLLGGNRTSLEDYSQLLGRAFGPAVRDGILSLLTDAELS